MVGVRVGLGVKVKRGLGVIEGVIVKVEGISEVDTAASSSVGGGSAVGLDLVRIRIETTKTITKTIPSKPIRKICWLDVF
jgi:hypothetical protein